MSLREPSAVETVGRPPRTFALTSLHSAKFATDNGRIGGVRRNIGRWVDRLTLPSGPPIEVKRLAGSRPFERLARLTPYVC